MSFRTGSKVFRKARNSRKKGNEVKNPPQARRLLSWENLERITRLLRLWAAFHKLADQILPLVGPFGDWLDRLDWLVN